MALPASALSGAGAGMEPSELPSLPGGGLQGTPKAHATRQAGLSGNESSMQMQLCLGPLQPALAHFQPLA